jgi:hypothetical protein
LISAAAAESVAATEDVQFYRVRGRVRGSRSRAWLRRVSICITRA